MIGLINYKSAIVNLPIRLTGNLTSILHFQQFIKSEQEYWRSFADVITRDFKITQCDSNENIPVMLLKTLVCIFSFKCSHKPSWMWIPRDHVQAQKGKQNFVVALYIYVLHKTQNLAFSHYRLVLQKRQINIQNSVTHVQSCCFAYIKPIVFWTFSLPQASKRYRDNSGSSCFWF